MHGEEEKFVKIVVDLPEPDMGVGGEGLWTIEMDENLYQIRNSPWHARNLNWGDIVRAVAANEQENPKFVEIVKRGGHRTIGLYIFDKGQARKEKFLAELQALGGSYEHADGKMYAFDFPPEADIDPALDYLGGLQEQGLIAARLHEY